MKTLRSLFMRIIAVMACVLIMAACGQKVPTPEEVSNRITANDNLTEADYAQMIDYCGKYAKDAQPYFDIINAQPNDTTAESVRATDQLASLYGSYPYLDQFRNVLAQTPMSKLGTENEKKINEYAKYQGFPLPEGEGAALLNPDVVGMIEDAPNSETTGVIATGDGEAVNEDVKN